MYYHLKLKMAVHGKLFELSLLRVPLYVVCFESNRKVIGSNIDI